MKTVGGYSLLNDERLLRFYLEMRSPEAQPWNLSPESLYIEYVTRDYIKSVPTFEGMNGCNVGIGVGEWDDYLGYWLRGQGTLTSVDINAEICSMFRYRQLREGHPNPSTVVQMDIFEPTLPESHFDLLTIIGSTVQQTGKYEKTLDSCFGLIKPDGHLIYMDFTSKHTEVKLQEYIQTTSHQMVDLSVYDRYPRVKFFMSTLRK